MQKKTASNEADRDRHRFNNSQDEAKKTD